MKGLFLAILIIIIVLSFVFLLQENDGRVGEAVEVRGEITEVAARSDGFTLRDGDGDVTQFAITSETHIINPDDEEVSPDYLRAGFSVNVEGTWISDTVAEAERIEITQEPPVILSTPEPESSISSPLLVQGVAKGFWFFEASFPVRLLDSDGEEVSIDPSFIMTSADWMTEEYVPFEATLEWSEELSGEGTLVLERSNPSGLPENDESISIPVTFGPVSERMTIQVHLLAQNFGETDCSTTQAREREIPSTQSVARAALTELFAGPTPVEEQQGITSAIPDGVEIQNLRIEDGTAFADFNQALQENIGGSCMVTAIRAQIENTLLQFSTVDDVVISIDGETETILQP